MCELDPAFAKQVHNLFDHACRRAGLLLLQIAGGPCFAALTAASVNTRTYFISFNLSVTHCTASSSWCFFFPVEMIENNMFFIRSKQSSPPPQNLIKALKCALA